jgi:hypothetical protein
MASNSDMKRDSGTDGDIVLLELIKGNTLRGAGWLNSYSPGTALWKYQLLLTPETTVKRDFSLTDHLITTTVHMLNATLIMHRATS